MVSTPYCRNLFSSQLCGEIVSVLNIHAGRLVYLSTLNYTNLQGQLTSSTNIYSEMYTNDGYRIDLLHS